MQFGKLAAALGGMAAMAATGALAQEGARGIPTPGGMGFQPASSSVAVDLQWLDGFLNIIMFGIVILVTALLGYVIFRFREDRNPTPARFTHNSLVEVVWTVVPIVILVTIAIPSLQLLDDQARTPPADLTIKATGNQWYWSYEYPDAEFGFDSYMVAPGFKDFDTAMADDRGREEIEAAGVTRETWRLATDTQMVVPVGKVVRMQVTAADVIHSWAMPAFGVKMDGIPGRLNETWFRADQVGTYYGQCSELCGKDHAYMPITVRAVPQADYEAWLRDSAEFYAGRQATLSVASAD